MPTKREPRHRFRRMPEGKFVSAIAIHVVHGKMEKPLSKGPKSSPNGSQLFDPDKYMSIDEFMQVLRETELITPFGRLPADIAVNQDNLKSSEWFGHRMQQTNYRGTRKEIIPLTPVVAQVLETERNLRDVDSKTSNSLPYGPQHTKKIVEDSGVTNYLLRLLSDKVETI